MSCLWITSNLLIALNLYCFFIFCSFNIVLTIVKLIIKLIPLRNICNTLTSEYTYLEYQLSLYKSQLLSAFLPGRMVGLLISQHFSKQSYYHEIHIGAFYHFEYALKLKVRKAIILLVNRGARRWLLIHKGIGRVPLEPSLLI